MTDVQLANRPAADVLEKVVVGGDLKDLNPAERVLYYRRVCESVGLNPLTRPFEYITLNGKLTLYARKDATDQMRASRGISITKLEREVVTGVYVVTAYAQTDGRADSSIGAVAIEGLKGDALANAMMKAETKAKRRVTLSIGGLGMLDETEVETVPNARTVLVAETGEIVEPPSSAATVKAPAWQAAFWAWVADYMTKQGLDTSVVKKLYAWAKGKGYFKEHLGLYDTMAAAQTDYMTSVGWFLKEQPRLSDPEPVGT